MKANQKFLLFIVAFIMTVALILLDKMGLQQAIEACEHHERSAEVEIGFLSWNVSCHEK
ncbi:hypothetical protein LS684_21465 (plasmid) [Cytobacillus spongiae]|uniref:hypothetical protein n=1 Tax=Cytobacillus spongiae TaxID=2901381 RepID=UPI00145F297A|nr:hypothetical protein [Cytobacillus spongiae]MCA1062546.1 hypothetical protein [Rossellomorea aquimaris]NMH71010.1 hypothetical protein [Bacillus sp. RO3]UII58190.1 hypothetical protein LS684_21465 [Cytobacillus spongiae]WJV28772.1 hypothetical protein QTG56_17255 [Rossellomorea sp. AcN35-11]